MSDFWTSIQQGANDAKAKAQEQYNKAKESEFWQRTQQQAQEAGKNFQTAANSTLDRAKEAVQGKRHEVVFLAPTLGMTLARQEGTGKAMIARVDESGAAATAGVEPGMIVVAIRAGRPGDESAEPQINITSYDQLMGLFPAMGRPVTITFLEPTQNAPTGGIVGYSMDEEIRKATSIVDKLTTPSQYNPDHTVPKQILQDAKGIAFIRVAKLGLGLSVKGGTGIVVARLGQDMDQWSAPCAIGTGGLGWGFQLGVELTDFMIILNTYEAVEAFASGQQVSLGGNVGIALGPLGRNGGLTANVHGGKLSQGQEVPVRVAPSYSYSHSKGAFLGVSLEGGVIKPRGDLNERFYNRPVTAREILSGMVPPPESATDLYRALDQAIGGDAPRYTPHAQPAGPVQTSPANPFEDASSHPTTTAQEAVAATVDANAKNEPEFKPLADKSAPADL